MTRKYTVRTLGEIHAIVAHSQAHRLQDSCDHFGVSRSCLDRWRRMLGARKLAVRPPVRPQDARTDSGATLASTGDAFVAPGGA